MTESDLFLFVSAAEFFQGSAITSGVRECWQNFGMLNISKGPREFSYWYFKRTNVMIDSGAWWDGSCSFYRYIFCRGTLSRDKQNIFARTCVQCIARERPTLVHCLLYPEIKESGLSLGIPFYNEINKNLVRFEAILLQSNQYMSCVTTAWSRILWHVTVFSRGHIQWNSHVTRDHSVCP